MLLDMSEPTGRALLDQAHHAATIGEDYERARQLYEQAANHGEIEGLYRLALMFRDGQGGPADDERAKQLFEEFIRLIRKAANEGDAIAQRRLGQMLQYGDGILKNETEAVRWITRAAENGTAEAQFHLSRLYAYGWCGLRENASAEALWLSKASDANYPEALYIRGVKEANYFLHSNDTSALVAARNLLTKAMEVGYGEAKVLLEQLSKYS